jgi:hypothetical protein
MPARYDRSAPMFRTAADLPGYIDELERLFEEHGVTGDRDKINASVRYLPHDETRIWKSAEAFSNETKTWAQFKNEVIKEYPGAAIEGLTTRGDLDALVEARAMSPITTRIQLGEYTRRFKVLASDLLRRHEGRLFSQDQANKAYLKGFAHGELREKIMQRLMTSDPDHNAELARDRSKVFTEADGILSGQRDAPARLGTANAAPAIKQEDLTAAVQMALKTQASVFDTRMASLESMFSSFMSALAPGAASSPIANVRPFQQPQPGASGSSGCHFCGGPCVIRSCPEVARYIQLGLLTRGPDGRLALPGGAYIPGNRGNPAAVMKDRVDEWHRAHPGQSALIPRENTSPASREQPPHLTSNFVAFSAPAPDASASGFLLESAHAPGETRIVELEEDETDPIQRYLREQLANCTAGDPRIHVFEAQINKRQAEVAEGVEKTRTSARANKGRPSVRFADEQHEGRANDDLRNRPAPSPIRDASPARDDSPPPEPMRAPAPSASSNRPAQVPAATPAPGPRPPASSKHSPRVIYPPKAPRQTGHSGVRSVAPIEEELAVDELVDNLLDSPLQNMTGRQLLGASYAARRELAARITPRKTTTDTGNAATSLYSSGPPPSTSFRCAECGEFHDHVAAHQLQKLRVLRPLISNQVEAECVIDSGSEGVMMRKDIWAATGLPLHVDDAISITAANSTTTRTLGGLRNVLFNIGGMEIYLQVQVIDEAPWEVLLGRSFFTHTACETKDSPDGSSLLTLTHPETGARVQVPTLERPNRHSPRKNSGFP